jgi:hypothetical protein
MQVSVQSELMKNHVAGRRLPAPQALAVAATSQQEPMLFSLDNKYTLTLTLPSDDSTTGWLQIDLGAQLSNLFDLGAQPVVQTFALAQDADGAMWLVLAAAPTTGQASRVFLSPKLPNSGLASDWATFGTSLIPRPIPASLVVSQLTLGNGDDNNTAPLVVAVAKESSGMVMHYQINPDPSDITWSCLPLTLPQNATGCLAAAVGNLPGFGRGVYALTQLGTGINLTFTTQPEVFDGHSVTRSIELALPGDLNPQTIAALATQKGETELYAGGQGIYRYSVSAQMESNLPGEWVSDAQLFSNISQLVVSQDQTGQEIGIWGTNTSDLLVHTVGMLDGTAYNWQAPVYLATETTAFGAYRDIDPGTNLTTSAMALGKTDGSLSLLIQDPVSTLWRPQSVSLQVTDKALEVNTYTSRILVVDDDGLPWSNQTVQIQPSSDCAALVNGQYYALKGSAAKPVDTDGNGTVTIVLETPDLAAPVYQLICNSQTLSTDPGEAIKTQLRGITTGAQIANAQRSDGKPLFPNGANQTNCDHTATALQKLMQAHDSLPPDGSLRSNAKLRRRTGSATRVSCFGIQFTPNGLLALQHDAALAALAEPRGIGEFWVTAGELFAALLSGNQPISQFFINEVEEGWEFLIDLGDRALKFIFEVGSQVMAATDWVFEQVLGLSFDDIIGWLGYLFDWDDILQNHRVITQVMKLGFQQVIAEVGSVEQQVVDAFTYVRSLVLNNPLIVDQSNAIFADRAQRSPAQTPVPTTQSPQSNWGCQQMQTNAAGITMGQAIIGGLDGLFTNLTDDEIQTVQNAINQFQTQLIDNFDQMTWGEILDTLLQIVGATLINTAENIALTFFEAVEVIIMAFEAMLNARWDIPVITYVYEEIICKGDGSKLTMLDAIALLTAIPSTLLYKAVAGQNLFSDAQAQAVLKANSWDSMMVALQTVDTLPQQSYRSLLPNRHLGGAQQSHLPEGLLSSSEHSPAEKAAISFQCLNFGTRTAAAVMFTFREIPLFVATKDRFNEVKVGCDWATYIFSVINMSLVLSTTSNPKTPRRVIDSTVTTSQILFRVKDTYLAGYKRLYQQDSEFKKNLCIAESVFGIAMVIAVCVSIGLEANEPPPDKANKDVWNSLLALKFIQNSMTGLYRTLSFVSILEGTPKVIGTVARGAMLFIRAGVSGSRASVECARVIVDMD